LWQTTLNGSPVVPQSMQAVLEYIEERSHNTPIVVYENGGYSSYVIPLALVSFSSPH